MYKLVCSNINLFVLLQTIIKIPGTPYLTIFPFWPPISSPAHNPSSPARSSPRAPAGPPSRCQDGPRGTCLHPARSRFSRQSPCCRRPRWPGRRRPGRAPQVGYHQPTRLQLLLFRYLHLHKISLLNKGMLMKWTSLINHIKTPNTGFAQWFWQPDNISCKAKHRRAKINRII